MNSKKKINLLFTQIQKKITIKTIFSQVRSLKQKSYFNFQKVKKNIKTKNW